MTSRRNFLHTAGAGLAGLHVVPLFGQSPVTGVSPNDKLQIALIGCGGMGQGDAKSSTATGLTKLVAASDCYDGRLEHMREVYGRDIFTSRKYEDVLARKDIDAVIIGAPDHWHRQITVDALKAGKHVYCEKPMVQHVDDGLPVIEAAKSSGKVVQIGSQRVSSVIYQKAAEIYKSGALGKLNLVEAWWDRNSAVGAWEYAVPLDAGAQTCDWERFQGRAAKTAWDPHRFFRWRCYQDYGTGVAGDLFVHLFSGLHFIIGSQGPTKAYATGGLRFWDDGRDVPDVLFGLFDYPETANHPAFNLVLRVNFVSGAGESSGFKFTGTEGLMTVGKDVRLTVPSKPTEPGMSVGSFSKEGQQAFLKQYRQKYPETRATPKSMSNSRDEVFTAPAKYDDHFDHHFNFAQAIRNNKPVVEDAVFGFRAAGPALLSNISYFEKRTVGWDPVNMKVVS